MSEKERWPGVLRMLEIEVKARVDDFKKVEGRILELGGMFEREETQVDTYFNHPGRDFAKTDEALRIRRVDGGYFFTYKGPKLDDLTKTREELEVGVEDFGAIKDILLRLGFFEVLTVEKRRRYFVCNDALVMLDDVVGLGRFVEVEKHADDYDPRAIVDFLLSLGVDEADIERRSYLELLLERGLL